jgi:hypothetical protein
MPDQLPIRIRRSDVAGKRPQNADLQLGELAINTYDARLFAKKDTDTDGVGIGTTVVLLTPWSENSDGSIYYNDGNVGLGTTNPTTKLWVDGGAYFTGILTARQIVSSLYGEFTGSAVVSDRVVATALTVSGISTLGTVQISSGIISATTGIVTYYGDASNLTKTFPLVTNVLYVTKNGNNGNPGTRLSEPKATIAGAVAAATAGTVIKVSAGTYLENNPITLPDQVSIVGDSLREVTVTPNNPGDLFYVGNGNYIAEMSFAGAATTGAIFSFDPNSIRYFNQSPYIQNCTNFIPNSTGLKIDGNNAIGPTKSMVLDSYTQYNQGGIGVSITNEGYAQLVSLFTICNDAAVYCGSGSACDLTNSNSSFGNYGLVADGVGPKKYTGIITSSVDPNADTFILDLNTPTLSISTARYDNTTGILSAYTTTPHGFSVGMGISLSSLQFTCAGIGGTIIYPSGQNGYVFEAKTVAPGRYYDSYNLIQANKIEIQDKSLAAIAIGHSDFYFPGDAQTNSRSRYYDSYRLIQKNRSVIVGTAWTNTYNVYPGISTTMDKCKRDIGYFIDAVSTDVFTGGNHYSREFVRQYFNANGTPINNGLVGEVTESIYAFNQARDLMKSAITNTLVGAAYSDLTITADPLTGFNTSPSSCANVRTNIDNLVGIVTTVIGAGSLVSISSSDNYGTFTTGGSKCYRDIGYLIDAVSLDVRDYTNQNIRNFIKQYFDSNGNPLINGLTGEVPESITAFNAVRDYAKSAITNQLNNKNLTLQGDPTNTDPTSCANVQTFIENLVGSVTSSSVGVATSKLNLPAVFAESTAFTCNVGVSTTPNQVYVSGGTAKINVSRPFDGQVIYFENLYYTVGSIVVGSGGTGYTSTPTITISSPDTSWGVNASAVANISNGSITEIEIISNGRGYGLTPPIVTISAPNSGINTATATAVLVPTYYAIKSSTPVSSGICTIVVNENLPYGLSLGTAVPFFKQSRVLASGHSFEYIGSGTQISSSLPSTGGVPIQANETDPRNGGLVVFTSTDQSGNFRIGDGVVVDQQTGTISGTFYSKSLFSTMTPFILALGGR